MGRARQALKLQVDEQLWGGEDNVEDETTAGEGTAKDQGAQEPEEAVDGKGEVEGRV